MGNAGSKSVRRRPDGAGQGAEAPASPVPGRERRPLGADDGEERA
jgi:hypothetical protein